MVALFCSFRNVILPLLFMRVYLPYLFEFIYPHRKAYYFHIIIGEVIGYLRLVYTTYSFIYLHTKIY